MPNGSCDYFFTYPAQTPDDDQQFVAYYVLDGCVRAVACCGESEALLRLSEALARTPLPTVDELRNSLQIFTETSPRKEGA